MSTFQTAPVEDPSWEIWTWGNGIGGLPPRIDRYFEVHAARVVFERNPPHFGALLEAKFPIYSFAPPQYPNAVIIDRERLEKRFGKEFLNSTAAWALALAIDELRPENGAPVDGLMGVFGVDAALGEEYAYQRQAIQHFIRLGRALGIEVGVAADSDLNITWPSYPDNMDGQLGARMVSRRADLRKHRDITKRSLDALSRELVKAEAALEELEWHCKYHGIYDV